MKFRLLGPGGRVWRIIRFVKQIKRQRDFEHQFHIGGNKHRNMHFYVIGINQGEEGLFSIVYQVLCHIEYALQRGMTPVVNMRDFPSMFFSKGLNVWEFFFEQPMGFVLDDVQGAYKATLSYDSHYPKLKVKWNVAALSKKELKHLQSLYAEYIRPSKEMKEYIAKNIHNSVFSDLSQAVGCICRGTDFFDAPKLGVAKQPTPEQMIFKVREFMEKNHLSKVYCATEDARIYQCFCRVFGDSLIPNMQKKYDGNDGKFLADVNKEKNIDVYAINKQYFLSLYLVTRCHSFVGGNVSGTNAVLMMDNNFKDYFVFQIGVVSSVDVELYTSEHLFDL